MTMSDKHQYITDIILTAAGTVTAVVSTLDGVEQIMRIGLLGISISSGVLLMLVNWKKGVKQVKEWLG